MNLNIRITGAAGAGVNSTVDIISNLFAQLGYDIITDIEYESRIKGGVNYFDVHISNNAKQYLTKKVDIVLAFNAISLQKQLSSLKDGATIIVNKKWLEKVELDNDTYNIISMEIKDTYDNTYLLGLLGKYLNFDIQVLEEKIAEVFAKKGPVVIEKNQNIIREIYKNPEHNNISEISIQKTGDPKLLTYGNKALTYGAIASDLEYYSAYPMTPASTILSEVIGSGTVKYLQAEDEISVINSALGASFTGARSMVGTSGGGFALMSEALSFAIQAEIPVTAVLSQRAGPSTGTPTYHEAGDINYALNPTFGDFDHVVLYPSTLEQAYSYGGLALNIADFYQIPVIILMDKQSSELDATHQNFIATPTNRGKIIQNPEPDYARYKITPDGISPRVKVGTKQGDFIATSYEHDEYGATSEDSDLKVAMTQKRFKKLETFYSDQNISGFEYYGSREAKKVLFITSFTSYTAKHFIDTNPEFGVIILTVLAPLDPKLRLFIVENSFEEIIFIENNFSGQIQNHVSKNFGLEYIPDLKISHKRKYDLFPFYIEDFNELK